MYIFYEIREMTASIRIKIRYKLLDFSKFCLFFVEIKCLHVIFVVLLVWKANEYMSNGKFFLCRAILIKNM